MGCTPYLEGPYKGNNDVAKAPNNPYDIDQSTSQEKVLEQISKWVLKEVRINCWIRYHKVPFWGFVVGNATLKIVGISELSDKSYRQSSRCWKDIREDIGKEEENLPVTE